MPILSNAALSKRLEAAEGFACAQFAEARRRVCPERVALFGGSATVPELRRRGLQTALLEARMRYAHDHGCDLAMMVAAPGSNSQRNAERVGFQIAYTRIKWGLR